MHQQVANAVLRGQAESLSTTLHMQVLRWWAQFNFGSAEVAPWPSWNTDPPEDQAAMATGAKTLGDAIASLKAAGVPVDERAMAEKMRIPMHAKAPEPAPPASEGLSANHQRDCGCSASHHAALAGQSAQLPPRVVEGQRYVDALVRDTAPRVQKAMQPIVKTVLDTVGASTSFEDLRAKLAGLKGAFDDGELAQVLSDAGELAGYAGAWSAKS